MLLSDGEIARVPGFCTFKNCGECGTECRMIAKAQLIKAWDWLNEPCIKHERTSLTYVSHRDYLKAYPEYPEHRYLCSQCRTEFEAEINKLKEGKE